MKSIFFILSSLFFITSCSNSNPEKAQGNLVTNPVSASDPNADIAGEAPIMTFVENIHNFGTLVDGEVVTHKFKFTNTGKTALIISSASASCGCTVPSYPKTPIQPGEEGAIDVEFNSSGKVGAFDKNITITANTIPTQFYLVIRGEVKPNNTTK
ncbi:MAG: DUF1573 domain-containing protein [Sphingobacteriales bacterium]|jgi:hypothetical protein|nr:DUF1573 domain-containing protein [Sphingobacteriales bacterium]